MGPMRKVVQWDSYRSPRSKPTSRRALLKLDCGHIITAPFKVPGQKRARCPICVSFYNGGSHAR